MRQRDDNGYSAQLQGASHKRFTDLSLRPLALLLRGKPPPVANGVQSTVRGIHLHAKRH